MKLARSLGFWGILLSSTTSMIGSGWLFGALYSAQAAGPAAILVWVIGAVAMFILALSFAEVGTLLPFAGGVSCYTQISHGNLCNFVIAWISWLSLFIVAPTEAQGALQYTSDYLPWLMKSYHGAPSMTWAGFGIAAALLLLFVIINSFTIRFVSLLNSTIAWWKIVIPLLCGLLIIFHQFHPQNFNAGGSFLPYGWHGVFNALIIGGAIYSFFGFRQVIMLAGESKNPGKVIPWALIISLILVCALYVLLQVSFIGALPANSFNQGWHHIHFANTSGPFASLAVLLGLGALAVVLYIDAIISPCGAGLIFTTSSARALYILGENGEMPKWMSKVNRFNAPYWPLIINFMIGLIFLLIFKGWQEMVSFIVLTTVIAYGVVPVSLISFRKQLANKERPFKLRCHYFIAFLGFLVCTLLASWTSLKDIIVLDIVCFIGGILFIAYFHFFGNKAHGLQFKHSIWMVIYLLGLTALMILGNFGGIDLLKHFWYELAVGIFSLIIFFIAIMNRQTTEKAEVFLNHLLS